MSPGCPSHSWVLKNSLVCVKEAVLWHLSFLMPFVGIPCRAPPWSQKIALVTFWSWAHLRLLQACMLAAVPLSLTTLFSSVLPTERAARNTYRDPIAKVLLRRPSGALTRRDAGVSALWEGTCCWRALQPEAFLWSSRRLYYDHFLCFVLCGLTRPGLTRWTCSVKQLETPAGHIRERQNAGDLAESVGALGASALRLLGEYVGPLVCSPGPFTVKLFIGLLWVVGKFCFL